ncbi:hypothetical protein CMV_000832 [Castanea mollissima]|uniref:Uncharacterized protein n=1 Tax=Castanea mollissima TaxID=60419 RepID=A0A8J4VXE0_9ROSI|nr:hypothetical protein CMV_000832 [Castanea mollissima]
MKGIQGVSIRDPYILVKSRAEVQFLLASIILYRNLGAAPYIAASSATVLEKVCNAPLAKMQKRLHSKIMEAKAARIKVASETLKRTVPSGLATFCVLQELIYNLPEFISMMAQTKVSVDRAQELEKIKRR